MLGYPRFEHLSPNRLEGLQSTGFGRPDQPRVARHIGGEDRGEAADRSHSSGKPMRRRPRSRVFARSAKYAGWISHGCWVRYRASELTSGLSSVALASPTLASSTSPLKPSAPASQ